MNRTLGQVVSAISFIHVAYSARDVASTHCHNLHTRISLRLEYHLPSSVSVQKLCNCGNDKYARELAEKAYSPCVLLDVSILTCSFVDSRHQNNTQGLLLLVLGPQAHIDKLDNTLVTIFLTITYCILTGTSSRLALIKDCEDG